MTNLNSSQNQIVQLPVLNNAPFEQTFRITVCMPHDQLYVARLGAKTKLSKLLEMVCQDKDLDRDKYEFRHPGKKLFFVLFLIVFVWIHFNGLERKVSIRLFLYLFLEVSVIKTIPLLKVSMSLVPAVKDISLFTASFTYYQKTVMDLYGPAVKEMNILLFKARKLKTTVPLPLPGSFCNRAIYFAINFSQYCFLNSLWKRLS